jgi:hypothetical protein
MALDFVILIVVFAAVVVSATFLSHIFSELTRLPRLIFYIIVGHARSMRYNAGNWPTTQYGDNVHEREKGMVNTCEAALVIWVNHSSVIATNLERLKLATNPPSSTNTPPPPTPPPAAPSTPPASTTPTTTNTSTTANATKPKGSSTGLPAKAATGSMSSPAHALLVLSHFSMKMSQLTFFGFK